ncbi:hypothetical protein Tco_0168743 [Tanacetum coccineum]
MDAPNHSVSAKETGDPIDIRVDIIHPEPVVAIAFPAAAIVRTQTQHGEAIRGIQEHLLGVPMQEELTALRFREKRARIAIERQFGFQLEFTATGTERTSGSSRNWSTETKESQTRRCRSYDQEGYTEAEVGDRVMLKVLEKVGAIAYKLELPQEIIRVHNTFHVTNLKKCYSDDPLVVLLEGLRVDDKLHFIEEPIEIMD